MTLRAFSNAQRSYDRQQPSQLSSFDEQVDAWLDACPFPLYGDDKSELRDMSYINTEDAA